MIDVELVRLSEICNKQDDCVVDLETAVGELQYWQTGAANDIASIRRKLSQGTKYGEADLQRFRLPVPQESTPVRSPAGVPVD